jgi:leucyl-tRNA synthetase
MTEHRYTAELAGLIEQAWQNRWEAEGTFHAPNPAGPWAEPDKVEAFDGHLLILDMFPYPSGAGLHVGHPIGYIATDVYARFNRMLGVNVLHCLGYDAFGLPAEQYAIETGRHPRDTTEENIAIMSRQLRRLGLGHDDRRSVRTIDPSYYRWTQWIFTQIFDAWYDETATRPDGGTGRARPIADLVAQFESGTRSTPDGRPWYELTPVERANVVDGYRLVHTAEAPVNWCPGLGTVLANEEVTNDGRSDRGNFPVFKRNLRQWVMRITAYADRLADDLGRVDWPENVKVMQRNWIGRSQGARIVFPSDGGPIEVFTTRPDTLFGTTFMVLAPEHPLVDSLIPNDRWPSGTDESWAAGAATPTEAVAVYRRFAAGRTDIERQGEGKDKTGVFTGGYATNPATGERIPVFVADYVLMGYGTGAVMGVPGEDQRDWEFAEKFHLPIMRTVEPPEGHPRDQAYVGEGPAINSANGEVSLNGLGIDAAKAVIIDWLTATGVGAAAVTYKLRDWLFARQRYWGEPFPVLFDDDGIAHAVPDSMLPVELPEVPDYTPATFDPDDADAELEAPLALNLDWVNVELDLGDGNGRRHFRRDTNVMPQWAGSCWYYLRYLDPANDETLVDPKNEAYWMGPHDEPVVPGTRDPGGVDLYVGGVEHAVLHLLYARFWHKVLYDLGHLSSDEPFRRYFSQGYIQASAFTDARGQHVPAEEIEEGPAGSFRWHGEPVVREFGKMGKSLKNTVSPDELYATYGADTFRLYEMGMGPLDQSKPWETRAVVGSQRFLQRLWRTIIDEDTGDIVLVDDPPDSETLRVLHRTIDAVRRDYESLSFNTAIARLTELVNALTKLDRAPREAAETLVLMVAPLAPHIAEELWNRLGHHKTLTYEPFPVADTNLLVAETVICVVQINGKVRDRIEVPAHITEDELSTRVLALPKVVSATTGGVRKIIVRAPKLVSVVSS